MSIARGRSRGVALAVTALALTGVTAPAQANPVERFPVPFVFFDTEVGDSGLVWFVNTSRELYCDGDEPRAEPGAIEAIASVRERDARPPAGRAFGRHVPIEVWPLNADFAEGGNGCVDTSDASGPFAQGTTFFVSRINDVTESGSPPVRGSDFGSATLTDDESTRYTLRWWTYRNDNVGIDTGRATLIARS